MDRATEATNKPLKQLIGELFLAKQAEDRARKIRTGIEMEIVETLGIPDDWEGSKTKDIDEYKVCFKRSMNIKIDREKLFSIAMEKEIPTAAMETAFRTKVELNKKGWDTLSDEIRGCLSEAITKTPGKISITTQRKEEE